MAPGGAAKFPLNRLNSPLAFSAFAPARTLTICWFAWRRPPSVTRLPRRRAPAFGAESSTRGDEGGDDRVEGEGDRAVVLTAAVLAEVEDGPVATGLRVFGDHAAEDDGVALGTLGVGGIDEVEFAVGRVVNVAVLDAGLVGAALDVVAGEAGVDLAEAEGDARAAEVEVVVVAGILVAAVVMEEAVLDALVDGSLGVAVAVGHDAHVVVVDVAVADGHVVGLVDTDAGAVVGIVVGIREFEAFQEAAVGCRG